MRPFNVTRPARTRSAATLREHQPRREIARAMPCRGVEGLGSGRESGYFLRIDTRCRNGGTTSKGETVSDHRIGVRWQRGDAAFERNNYPREHEVRFDGGQAVRNSAAPDYGGDEAASNPEELLLAALSTCHMLTFLAVVANRGYVVDAYTDDAVAVLDKNADGKTAVTKAVLSPKVTFGGDKRPGDEEYAKYHERAHAACFIANSVKTEVVLKL
jgi:organic hydroperoxide reductase OsmC/OhrA